MRLWDSDHYENFGREKERKIREILNWWHFCLSLQVCIKLLHLRIVGIHLYQTFGLTLGTQLNPPPYGGLLLEVRMTKPKPSVSLRWSVMSKDSWSSALGIGRRGSLGEPLTSTGVISWASSSVASEDMGDTDVFVFATKSGLYFCVWVCAFLGGGYGTVCVLHLQEIGTQM